MPSPLGLLKNNDLALRARSLFLRRPRGWALSFTEVRKDFGSTAPSDISFVKEHLSRYAKHIYFLRVSNAQMTHVNRTRPDRKPSRITKRQLRHVFSKSRKEGKRARSHLMKNLPKMLKLCRIS